MGISAGVASVASIASIGLSAYASVEKGQGQKAANEMQAAQLERAAEIGRLQADLTDTTMRERLNTTISNIDAIRASGNVDPSSPTTMAIEDLDRKISDRRRTAEVGSLREDASTKDASARYLRQAGDFAVSMGNLGAGITIASGIAQGFGPKGSFSGLGGK